MKSLTASLLIIASIAFLPTGSIAQNRPQEIVTPNGILIIPDSSVEEPGDRGQRAHTNHLLLVPQKGTISRSTAPVGETPGSLACVYQTASQPSNLASACTITGQISSGNNGLSVANGGGGIIAIVDAYDYPTAESDLNVYSDQFGLPSCTTTNGCFQRVFAAGTKPSANCGWAQEAALDIQIAHAMAPNAKIVLIEAASSSFTDWLSAADVASKIVQASGRNGQVSMSWGGSEFSSEVNNDLYFTASNVVYFAASGDSGGKTIWPGVSPNVVSAGGTSINEICCGGYFSEPAWKGGGGGVSE